MLLLLLFHHCCSSSIVAINEQHTANVQKYFEYTSSITTSCGVWFHFLFEWVFHLFFHNPISLFVYYVSSSNFVLAPMVFLFMLKCNKLPTFHRTCSKPFFTTHKTLSLKAPAFGPKIFRTWSYERGYFSMFVQINKTMYVTLKQYYFQLPNLFWQFFSYENYCSVVFVCFTISTKRLTEKQVNYTKNAMKLSVFFWDTFIMAFYYQ